MPDSKQSAGCFCGDTRVLSDGAGNARVCPYCLGREAMENQAEVERLRVLLRGAIGFIERNPGPYDVADWLERAREATAR